MTTYEIQSIYDPVFVSDVQADEYRENCGEDSFVAGGWYIQAQVRLVEGQVGEHNVGAVIDHYYGPYGTEQEALIAIPQIAPGILVHMK